MVPTNEYVEIRNDGYYVAGTRIGLDVVVYDFRGGRSADAIFEAYPSIGSLAKVYGALTFILEHPEAIETHLQEQDALWEIFRREHPIPEHLLEKLRRTKEELARRSA